MKAHGSAALVLGISLALGLALSGQASGSFHRSYSVSGAVDLQVETGSGSIRVTSAPGAVVTVDATIRESDDWLGGGDPQAVQRIESNPPIEQDGNYIHIRTPREDWANHLSISYVITTPANTALRAQSGSGAIEVTGLSGATEMDAGSGRLQVGEITGSLRAQTGSGSIAFDRIGGNADVSTGSGSIDGNEVAGRFTANTGSGHISVQRLGAGGDVHAASGSIDLDQVAGDLSAHAASGSIHAGGELSGDHAWTLSTASGGIHLSLPSATSAEVRLETSSGRLSINHPMRTSQEMGRHSWEGVMGDGAPTARLEAHTASGSISVN